MIMHSWKHDNSSFKLNNTWKQEASGHCPGWWSGRRRHSAQLSEALMLGLSWVHIPFLYRKVFIESLYRLGLERRFLTHRYLASKLPFLPRHPRILLFPPKSPSLSFSSTRKCHSMPAAGPGSDLHRSQFSGSPTEPCIACIPIGSWLMYHRSHHFVKF